MLIVTAICIMFYFDLTEKMDPVTNAEHVKKISNKNEQEVINVNGNEEKTSIKYSSSHDYNYDLSQSCGFDSDKFYDEINRAYTDNLANEKLEHLENLVDNCTDWFDKLSSLSNSDIKSIELEVKRKHKILSELSSLKYDKKTLTKATSMVFNKDPEIAGTALLYLLSFDNSFLIKIGEGMGITDIEFLRGNINLSFLFVCQNGMDCSSDSSLMTDLCLINENSCGLSFESSLMRQITPNQYDDYLHALQVINSIINSDWFEQRDILNPTDP